jgi:acyl carrier protein phosphodiesterase
MNFLSHFYFDRYSANPELVLGCVMPDLLKTANKTWNIHPEKKPHLFKESERMQSLFEGWKRHLEVDRYFHNCDFFIEHTRAIRQIVAPVLINSEIRPSFFAHISLELMLDSLLLNLEEVDAFEFYDQLANVERTAVKDFLELNLISDTRRFFRFFDQFLEENYLHSYSETENLIYSLNKVCLRLWPQPLSSEEKFKLNVVLLDYQEHLENSYKGIFEDVGRRLKLEAYS